MVFVKVALFNLSIEMVRELALASCENSGIGICSDGNLIDFQYADDVALLSENLSKLQVFIDRLDDTMGTLGIHFASRKCEMLSRD